MVTGGEGTSCSRIPAVRLAEIPPGGMRHPCYDWQQDNGTHRDDNRTMTDEQNGNAGAASPFGGMQINFGAADAAPAGNGTLNPFGAISIISDGADAPAVAQPAGPVGYTRRSRDAPRPTS